MVLGGAGTRYLEEGRVEGEDPLARFAPTAAQHLLRTQRVRPRAGPADRQLLRPRARRGLRLRGADLVPRRARRIADASVPALPGRAAARPRSRSSGRRKSTACSPAGGGCSRGNPRRRPSRLSPRLSNDRRHGRRADSRRRPGPRRRRSARDAPHHPPLPEAHPRGGAAREPPATPTSSCSAAGRSTGGPSEAEQMRDAWSGPDVELVVEPTARQHGRERGADAAAPARAADRAARSWSAHRRTSPARACSSGRHLPRRGRRGRVSRGARRAEPPLRAVGARGVPVPAGAAPGRAGRARAEAAVSDTVVFIPAWNEEENLPAVLDGLRAAVARGRTCSSSTTARPTGRPRSRASTGQRCSRSARTRACGSGSRPATAGRSSTGYAFCGRVDADGQHPAEELLRLLERVPRGRVRRRGRLPLRVRRRIRAVPVPAEPPRGASARVCCGARSASCCAARSATRRAASTPSTRRRCRCSPSRTRAARPRSRR